jgi:checkpoint serine/threonine-protein kinase
LSVTAFCIQSLPHFNYDQVTDPAQQQVTVNQKGRTERIFVNLEAIYHTPEIVGSEWSLEELRAGQRGWLSKIWQPEIPSKHEDSLDLQDGTGESNVNTDEIVREVSEKLVIARDPVTLDENGAAKENGREGRGRRMKIKEVNETQISKLKIAWTTC